MTTGKVTQRFNRQFVGYDVQVYGVFLCLSVYKSITMKDNYENIFNSWYHKRMGTWNEIAEELNPGMVSVGGMKFIFKGCETNEKRFTK